MAQGYCTRRDQASVSMWEQYSGVIRLDEWTRSLVEEMVSNSSMTHWECRNGCAQPGYFRLDKMIYGAGRPVIFFSSWIMKWFYIKVTILSFTQKVKGPTGVFQCTVIISQFRIAPKKAWHQKREQHNESSSYPRRTRLQWFCVSDANLCQFFVNTRFR